MPTLQEYLDDRPTLIALSLIACVLFWRFSILVARPDKEWAAERDPAKQVHRVQPKPVNMASTSVSCL